MEAVSLLQRSKLFLSVVLLLAVFAAFGNALHNGFVYDDGYLIVKNEKIRSFANFKDLLVSDVTVSTPIGRPSGYYRPVSMAYLAGVYQLSGLNPFGWHLGSILLHGVNTILVFLILGLIFSDSRIAFLSALLFAVHPIHVEAVTPIYNVMGVLATTLSLLSFLFYLKSYGMKNAAYALLSALFLLLGVFAKEDVASLPLIYLLYEFLTASGSNLKQFQGRILKYLIFLIPVLLYALARFLWIERDAAFGLWNVNVSFNVPGVVQGDIFVKIMTIAKLYGRYVFLLVFPFQLNAFHEIPMQTSFVDLEALACLMLLGLLIGGTVFYAKRFPPAVFADGFFFLSSLLVSNIFPIGGIFAERFMYFPSIAFCLGIVYGYTWLKGKGVIKGDLPFYLIIAFFLLLTVTRNYAWRNDLAIWEDTIKKSPNSFTPRLNLATAYFETGKYREALDNYQQALNFKSGKEYLIYNIMGKIYGLSNIYPKAVEYFKMALDLNPNYIEIYYNLGITSFREGNLDEAEGMFRKAIALDSKYPWAYYGMGLCLEKKKNIEQAAEMYLKALSLDPNFPISPEFLERLSRHEPL